jgi:bifunctional DNA-binding transcriptional regulator/antitoxin component of YhaV-PrlF toxin-antitoxin module
MQTEETDVAIVGTKGQIVIPQRFRNKLKITPKTKVVIRRRGENLVITKLTIPEIEEDLEALFKEIDEQYKGKKRPTEKEILKEIQTYRRENRIQQGA